MSVTDSHSMSSWMQWTPECQHTRALVLGEFIVGNDLLISVFWHDAFLSDFVPTEDMKEPDDQDTDEGRSGSRSDGRQSSRSDSKRT